MRLCRRPPSQTLVIKITPLPDVELSAYFQIEKDAQRSATPKIEDKR
jgi:hypothetical protein